MNANNTDRPVLTALREMEIGETLVYPISRTSYIRTACVSFGLEWGKKFKTSTSRADSTITVIRTA